MLGFMRKTIDQATSFFTPALAIAGAGLFSYGAYLIYRPAAFVVGGVFLLLAAWDAGRE